MIREQKAAYLYRIRSSSAYPAFRVVIRLITFVLYVVAALAALGGLLGTGSVFRAETSFIVVGIAILIAIVARVGQETSLMLAGLADSIIDFNARRGGE